MSISNKEYILKWIEKSKQDEDNFEKFVYGFFALNAMYSIYYERDERRAIKALFASSLDNHFDEFRKILYTREFDYSCNRPAIKNCKFNPLRDDPRTRDTSEFRRSCLSLERSQRHISWRHDQSRGCFYL